LHKPAGHFSGAAFMTSKKKRPRGWLLDKQQIDDLLARSATQLSAQDYEGALRTCKRILRYLPKKDKVRAEALGMMGMAYAIQKKFEDSYQILSEAVQIDPDDSYLLFNRGLSARFTSRTGRSLRDFEKVDLMSKDSIIAGRIRNEIKIAKKVAYSEMALRGKDFTLDQLIEQQELFQHGNNLSGQGRWKEAEAAFRKSIEMGECLPQPWGNLGICLVMQNRFDEAEDAYRRALKIDPKYKRAKENLKSLDYWRKHPDEKPEYLISSPFQDVKTNITFYQEGK
jgi:tetratricopeptide (TPR) repeat protein